MRRRWLVLLAALALGGCASAGVSASDPLAGQRLVRVVNEDWQDATVYLMCGRAVVEKVWVTALSQVSEWVRLSPSCDLWVRARLLGDRRGSYRVSEVETVGDARVFDVIVPHDLRTVWLWPR